METSPVMLLAILGHHIFQSMSVETFHSKENCWRIQCEEELHPAVNKHSIAVIEPLTRRKCPAIDII